RMLRSFPTRRSSDLPVIAHATTFRPFFVSIQSGPMNSPGALATLPSGVPPQAHRLRRHTDRRVTHLPLDRPVDERRGILGFAWADRKSTRLNSSHVK